MSRLIDADGLKKRIPITHVDEYQKCWKCTLLCDWEVENLVDHAPTIDAVEVVRCKDCKHYDIEIPSRCIKDRCYCATVDSFMKPMDYCSYAERRSDE